MNIFEIFVEHFMWLLLPIFIFWDTICCFLGAEDETYIKHENKR